MKNFLILTLMTIGMSALCENTRVMKYLDTSSTNITTSAWVTCTSTTKMVNHTYALNNSNCDLLVCLTESSTDCTTTNQFDLLQGTSFVFDKFPSSSAIFLKSKSGTCNSGIVSCGLWRSRE